MPESDTTARTGGQVSSARRPHQHDPVRTHPVLVGVRLQPADGLPHRVDHLLQIGFGRERIRDVQDDVPLSGQATEQGT